MYDKATHIFTNSHLMQPIVISNDRFLPVFGASGNNALTTKKNEKAAIDSVLQQQDTWLDLPY
jgi:hypothetical protein